jgi:serine O-acetyltransferase
MNEREAYKADRARYPECAFRSEQSLWAIWVYRFGRNNDQRSAGVIRSINDLLYRFLSLIVQTLTGCCFTKSVEIGPGLRIYHFGNIFIHNNVKIGANCTLRQGVTIGVGELDGPVPVIEDDVEFGAYAQVLGGVRIGRGAKIGAMSVVLQDVPSGAIAVGIPARILPQKPRLREND